jgi:thiol-disulfide isomerase/thioredoxin
MENLILCALLISLVPAAGDDSPATTAAPPEAAPAPADEKAAAIDINTTLVAMAKGGDTSKEAWAAIDAKLDNYQKQFGVTVQTTHNMVLLRKLEMSVVKRSGDMERYDALLQKISIDPQPEIAALATKLVALKSKPLDLKYTAVDGTTVDLSQMRGKVVLIDFWATWCGPCVGEVPNVVAAYQKYHGKGFEIVGVSLDQDKDAMLAFTKDHGMTWPQYFDGKVWKNDISTSYDINSIPSMWLVGKDGKLITEDAREDLAGQVEKALAVK